ncbi:MAG: hypothetical protein LBB94_03415 [Clostridiales bacterium]|nr:hypothetical protein [Clostridiales bacterium]
MRVNKMSDYVLKLKKPMIFEGTEYKEIDFSGLETLNTRQLKEADKMVSRNVTSLTMKEVTLEYACIIAYLVTNLPLEFFDGLGAQDGVALRIFIMNYFFE